jgi:hypothetical protein
MYGNGAGAGSGSGAFPSPPDGGEGGDAGLGGSFVRTRALKS